METVTDFIFLGSKITRDCDYSQEIKRHLLLGTKALTNLDNIWKSKDISLPKKVHIASNSYDFSSSHVQMSEWTIKKAEHWRIDAVMLEKTLESALDRKKIKATNPKGNQLWIFTGRTEAPTVWPTDAKSRLWKRLWCWERLKAQEGDRGWDNLIISLTQQTWIWANSGR